MMWGYMCPGIFARARYTGLGNGHIATAYTSRRRRPRRSRTVRRLSRLLLAAGVFSTAWWMWNWVELRAYDLLQQRKLDRLEAQVLPVASLEPTPQVLAEAPVLIAPGELIGRIEMPRLGLSAIVVEGVDKEHLENAVGHLPASSLPGRPGNIVLAGHRDTLFRPLRHVRTGDTIVLRVPGQDLHYRVESTQVVEADAVEVLAPFEHEGLTLITCYPFNYVGPAPRRFIVQGRRIETEPASLASDP